MIILQLKKYLPSNYYKLSLIEHLSWKNHVILLIKKLIAILVAVMKIRPCLSKNALLIIYRSFIMSQ